MTTALAIVGGIAGLAVVLVVVSLLARRVAAKVTADALTDVATVGAIAVAPALLGGVSAPGIGRARGNGVLALHPGRLVFVLGVPRRTIEIPLAQIHDVEVSKALRTPGRYARNGRPWLMVRWKAPDGEGVIGVLLPDPQRWAQAIRPNEWRDTTG